MGGIASLYDKLPECFKGDDSISNYGILNNKLVKIDYADLDTHWGEDKLSGNQPKYKFTEDEENRLFQVLRDMAGDIEKVAGLTFNQALKNVIGK